MNIEMYDPIVLAIDLPEQGLKRGDVGTVVELYEPDAVQAEFLTGIGRTHALVTLRRSEVRPVGPTEILTVRKLDAA